ncbi:MAG: roadblock/LC7 domain-containing protein [Vulcanimicrobiota bacterium]
MSETHDILESLCTVEGVTGAFLIDEDANIIDFVAPEDFEVDNLAGLSHKCIESGIKIAGIIDKKEVKQTFIEYADSNLTLDLLSNGVILALLASSGANLGRIRLELRKTKKKVEKELG